MLPGVLPLGQRVMAKALKAMVSSAGSGFFLEAGARRLSYLHLVFSSPNYPRKMASRGDMEAGIGNPGEDSAQVRTAGLRIHALRATNSRKRSTSVKSSTTRLAPHARRRDAW